eukprot:4530947-Pleurochrysis_carterae.AAC.1
MKDAADPVSCREHVRVAAQKGAKDLRRAGYRAWLTRLGTRITHEHEEFQLRQRSNGDESSDGEVVVREKEIFERRAAGCACRGEGLCLARVGQRDGGESTRLRERETDRDRGQEKGVGKGESNLAPENSP